MTKSVCFFFHCFLWPRSHVHAVWLRPRQSLPSVYLQGFMVRFYITCLIHLHLVLNVVPKGGQFRCRVGDRPVLPAALTADLSAPPVRTSSVGGSPNHVGEALSPGSAPSTDVCACVDVPSACCSDCGSLTSVHTDPGQAPRPSVCPRARRAGGDRRLPLQPAN